VTFGAKFEDNTHTGFSVQPSMRALWAAGRSQTIWGAVSRALRTPDLFESGARLNVGASQAAPQAPIVQVAMIGQPDLAAEKMVAYELGYRAEPTSRVSLEVASFYNSYRDLIDFYAGTPRFETSPGPPHLLVPLVAANGRHGESFGIEASGRWQPASFLRTRISTFRFSRGRTSLPARRIAPASCRT
jgi:iron complex outermembrane receptor protein